MVVNPRGSVRRTVARRSADNGVQGIGSVSGPIQEGWKEVAVRLRMKQMGRKHRAFYRIVAIDSKQPRDGRVLEELGTYDPAITEKEKRVSFDPARVKFWLSKGAQPSEHVAAFIKRYMETFEKAAAEAAQAQPTA